MDRSSASEPSQKENTQHSSTRIRVRKIPSTPRPEVAALPMSHAKVSSTVSATQPPETSSRESYLKIIKNMTGKFSPAGKISDLLTHMADEIRKEKANPNPLPLEISTEPTLPVRAPAAHPLDEPTTSFPTESPTRHNRNQEDEAEVEEGEEGNSQGEGRDGEGNDETNEGEEEGQRNENDENQEGLVERRYAERADELVVLEEKGSEDDEETLTERAVRRNLRTAKKREAEGTLVEIAATEVEEFQKAERKRKGKQTASTKKGKPRQASLSVGIQEPNNQSEEKETEQEGEPMETSESEGVYEKMEVTVDKVLLKYGLFQGPET